MARRKSGSEKPSGNPNIVTDGFANNVGGNPDDVITIDPAAISASVDGTAGGNPDGGTNPPADSGTGDAPRKRGRPRGSTNSSRSKNSTSAIDVNSLELMLFSTHQMLAAVTKTPEFKIEETEAKELAKAAANVARHYDMGASQKTLDWGNLIQVLALMYGSRVFAIRNRKREENAEDDNIVRFPPGTSAGMM